eukprot:365198-Chlamydomonas_euryale.AAC.5
MSGITTCAAAVGVGVGKLCERPWPVAFSECPVTQRYCLPCQGGFASSVSSARVCSEESTRQVHKSAVWRACVKCTGLLCGEHVSSARVCCVESTRQVHGFAVWRARVKCTGLLCGEHASSARVCSEESMCLLKQPVVPAVVRAHECNDEGG